MTLDRWLLQARSAANDLRASGGTFPFAEAFYLDRPTHDLLEALEGLGILHKRDLRQVPERGPLINAA